MKDEVAEELNEVTIAGLCPSWVMIEPGMRDDKGPKRGSVVRNVRREVSR